MPAIEERRDKSGRIRYRAQVRMKGFPTESATFDRKRDAERWAASKESGMREGRYFKTAESKRRTVTDLVERYIEEVIPNKPRSGAKYAAQLEWFNRQIGHMVLADLTPAVLTEYRDKLRRKFEPGTVNRYMAALSHALTIAMREWQWIEDSPARKVSRLKEPPGRVRYLDPKERERLLNACREHSHPHLYDAVLLALTTGARKNEIMHLKWSEVDLHRGQIALLDTKNQRPRVVPIAGEALQRMRERARIRQLASPYVFPSPHKPNVPADIDREFAQARDAAKLPGFRFHDLRHTAASYLAMSGASTSEIASVLGHRTLQMVQRYAHLSDAHTSAVVSRMVEKFLTPQPDKAAES